MKKRLIIGSFVILILFLVSGCQQATSPNLSDIKVEPSYVKQGEKFSIGFVVNNPLTVAFQGKVEFKSDCFENQPAKKEVSVSASSDFPFESEFTAFKAPSYSSDKNKCKGTQQITILLEDSDDKVVASYATKLNIVE